MDKELVLTKLRELKPIYEKEGVVIKGIFGSVARGEEREDSDIDIAYKLNETLFFSKYKGFRGATKLSSIAKEIEREMGRTIDFVSMNSINSELNSAIMKDLVL